MRKFFLFLLILFISVQFFGSCAQAAEQNTVVAVNISGPITTATPQLLSEALESAKNSDAKALVIILDTPGGGLTETFEIANIIDTSTIPIIGYVHPRGGRAVSAGTFILMSTHLAAMAPNTIIGSCQPVEITAGGTRYITENKTINHLVKFMEEHADMHDRNKSAVEKFVTENLNLNDTEAKELGVIEATAASLEELLNQVDGRNVSVAGAAVILSTRNATIIYHSPSIKLQILAFLSNPLVASLLLMLGIFGIIIGISTPGHGAEIFGVVAICLGLIGTGLNLNYIALFILLFGAALLLIELFTPGFGVIGCAGIICLIIGSIFLVPMTYPRWLVSEEFQRQLIVALLAPPLVIAGFFVFAFFKALKIKRKKPEVGVFVDEEADTIDELSPEREGFVMFKGEYWKARSSEHIPAKTRVIVMEKDHITLIVKKKENI